MRKILVALGMFCALIFSGQSNSQLAESFLKTIVRSQYDSCRTYFDTSVTEKVNASMMQQMWERIPNFVGEFKSYENIRSEKVDTIEVILITCAFEKTKLDLKLSFNRYQKIIGIFFVPVKSNAVYNVPDYYQATKLYESKIPLKTGEYTMPGMLSVPNNIENPPIVILLAGSGPNDKDESIGPNKVLRDLALGLASNGIACYRYDKRTFAESKKLANNIDKVGINEEVIEDALSAIKLLRTQELTKNSKIYILGHSLGAMCAPLIAQKSKEVSGIIMMAGPYRPLEDVIVDQYNYIFALDSTDDASEIKYMEELLLQVKTVKNPKLLKKAHSTELPLGMPSYYWESLNNYDQVKTAKIIKQPILILQGERDYQVPNSEFLSWKKELQANSKNKFISYKKLNHLFISGENKSVPSEYMTSGNVNEQVILDITNWIKSNK